MVDFSLLPRKAQERLTRISNALNGVVPTETKIWKIRTNILTAGSKDFPLIKDVKAWSKPGCIYLYTLSLPSNFAGLSRLVEVYKNAKTSEKHNRAYARLNDPSSCLYVGSSEKIHQRIKEHLGFGAQGTYSLQLAYWASTFDLELAFECAKYAEGATPEVIQTLEDTLWAELKPMFGRQGAR